MLSEVSFDAGLRIRALRFVKGCTHLLVGLTSALVCLCLGKAAVTKALRKACLGGGMLAGLAGSNSWLISLPLAFELTRLRIYRADFHMTFIGRHTKFNKLSCPHFDVGHAPPCFFWVCGRHGRYIWNRHRSLLLRQRQFRQAILACTSIILVQQLLGPKFISHSGVYGMHTSRGLTLSLIKVNGISKSWIATSQALSSTAWTFFFPLDFRQRGRRRARMSRRRIIQEMQLNRETLRIGTLT